MRRALMVGTINITPFTDLMIRNIAGAAVDAFLASPSGLAALTADKLNAERVALTDQLKPALLAMGLGDSIDLLRTTFNADSTGLDRFMDVVKVSTSGSTATITNILDAAAVLTIQTSTGASAGTLGTAGLASSGTPADLMLQTAKAFSNQFATSLPSPSSPDLLALLSSTFMDDGESGSVLLTNLTSDNRLIGLKFSNMVIDSISADGMLAQVRFTPLSATGEFLADDQPDGALKWQMKQSAGGVWQFDGNQRIAHARVTTIAEKNVCALGSLGCSGGTTYRTGLWMEIENRAALPIGKAVVTGPGLPAAGVTLLAQANQTWFRIDTVNTNNPSCLGCSDNRWYMADGEIAALGLNSTYAMNLYSNAATPVLLATYTSVVPVAPVLSTVVASLAYPSLTGMVTLNGLGSTTLTPSWAIPAGLKGGSVGVSVWQSGTPGQNQSIWADVAGISGATSLGITAPAVGTWQGGSYWIDARDGNGGQIHSNYLQ
jgi:hypothetical protein